MFKTTGAGDVTYSDPHNNTVIAHFEGEQERCNLTCEVKNNGTLTDTVWSYRNGSAESTRKITSGYDIFNVSRNYSNHLQIVGCSLRELSEVLVYCGSHENLKQAMFELKVCGELIWH
jgi:hypothetical protein